MNKLAAIPGTITASIDVETLAIVEQLAQERGITSAEFASEAVRWRAESEADFRAFIQVGIDAADRDDLIPHDEGMVELDAIIEKHRARCSK